MAESVILTEVRDGVAVVTMNRPDARNALNRELRAAVPAALTELDADPDVHAMILTGADPAFCAGLDLKELSGGSMSAAPTELGSDGDAEASVTNSPLPFGALTKPLIGAVNGPAVTGGFELALGCDFLIASERARFADTHARVGVMPGWGLTVLLPQAIGIRRARQMSFTGNYVDAATALEWGLVNQVVPHDELLDAARALASDMGSIPLRNLQAIKAAYRAAGAPFDDPALAAENRFAGEWIAGFDREALAANREAIQSRGSAQAG
jgi:enoyl-CoA hydratase